MSDILNEFRPTGMKVLMLTGALAQSGLTRIMDALAPRDFEYEIRIMPVQVAAWLNTHDLVEQIGDVDGFDLVIIPGKTSGDEYDLERAVGTRVVKGPNCYSGLPDFFEEQGFALSAEVPRPKIVIMGDDRAAKALASRYEIPCIDFLELVEEEKSAGSRIGKEMDGEIRHNVKAEVIRGRLALPDTRNGWVMINYPTTSRDLEWLREMDAAPDAIIDIGSDTRPVGSNDPLYVEIPTGLPDQSTDEMVLVKVEERMNACVIKS